MFGAGDCESLLPSDMSITIREEFQTPHVRGGGLRAREHQIAVRPDGDEFQTPHVRGGGLRDLSLNITVD